MCEIMKTEQAFYHDESEQIVKMLIPTSNVNSNQQFGFEWKYKKWWNVIDTDNNWKRNVYYNRNSLSLIQSEYRIVIVIDCFKLKYNSIVSDKLEHKQLVIQSSKFFYKASQTRRQDHNYLSNSFNPSSNSFKTMALIRLSEERKHWRKKKPWGFFARPSKNPDGSTNLRAWKCGILGKKGTDWANGQYRLSINFGEEYPHRPPSVQFDEEMFHPNIYLSGRISLDLLNETKWKGTTTIKQILLAIQELLASPNIAVTKRGIIAAANVEAATLFTKEPDQYARKIRQMAKKYML